MGFAWVRCLGVVLGRLRGFSMFLGVSQLHGLCLGAIPEPIRVGRGVASGLSWWSPWTVSVRFGRAQVCPGEYWGPCVWCVFDV